MRQRYPLSLMISLVLKVLLMHLDDKKQLEVENLERKGEAIHMYNRKIIINHNIILTITD